MNRMQRIATGLLLVFAYEILFPVSALALTGGPSQPEVQSFEPVGTTDMVDLFSGDFNYNIPLLDVGGYPVNISYHSGVTMDQEASWVGLGWNINPGVINRNMRGLPDDFQGEAIEKSQNMRSNWTTGIGMNGKGELFGISKNIGVNLGVFYNNYKGVGYEFGFSPTMNLGGHLKASLNMNFNSQNGVDISPSASFSTIKDEKDRVEQDVSGFKLSASAGFNSRSGVKALSINAGLEEKKVAKNPKKDYEISGMNGGSSISFGTQTWVPSVSMPFTSVSVTFSAAFGPDAFGMHKQFSLRGYFTKQYLAFKDQTVSKRAYGYMYGHLPPDNDVLMDFNREKDGEFNSNSTNLPVTNHTYDIYSVSGQGIGGMYRLHRGDMPYVYDSHTQSTSLGGSLGLELGAGAFGHFGVDIQGNFSRTSSGKWEDNNTFSHKYGYIPQGMTDVNPVYEHAYFKNAGEKTPVDMEYLNKMGNFNAVRVPVYTFADYVSTYNYLETDGADITHKFESQFSARKQRDKRNQSITYLTAEQARVAALDKDYYSIPLNAKYQGNGFSKIPMVRTNYGHKNYHLSEMTSLGPDGTRYVYGIPAYNYKQVEATFNVDNDGSCLTGQVDYDANDNTTDNSKGDDHYFTRTTTPQYAHSYLLTGVLSPDYVDVQRNGITDDDLGTAVKINYTQVYSSYKWRVPVGQSKATYDEGLKSNTQDDKGSYVYGEKEMWYMHSIESKNQVALFKISRREDGLGVLGENGGKDTSVRSYKLDSIMLYNKQDLQKNKENAIPIKVVHFEYDYSLCPSVENNTGSSFMSNDVDLNVNKGKLTLKRIYFTYGNSFKGRLSPYKFTYSSFNPDYNLKGYDRWGNYAPNATSISACDPSNATLPSAEYPYTTQDKTNADQYAGAWSLTQVYLPSGGTINVTYEADDYAYVQDKQAMQMLSIEGFGKDKNATPANKLYDKGIGKIEENTYMFFTIGQSIAGNSAAELERLYFKGINELFFNIMSDIDNQGHYEYVRGYAEIDRSAADCFGVVDNNTAWVKLKTERIGDREGIGEMVNPMAKASWNYARLYTPKLVYPFSQKDDENAYKNLTQPITQLMGITLDIMRMVTGFNRSLRMAGFGSEVNLSKSWFRSNAPYKKKLGGGCRVKRIEMSDEWANMRPSGESPTTFSYGQDYTYTMNETQDNGTVIEISSGVASYEPGVGNEENPWRQPVYTVKENRLAPDDRFYKETPFGESFFPSPSVGYRKVKVQSITPSTASSHNSGSQVSEFYTTYEFPTIVKQTGLKSIIHKPNPVLQILHMENEELVAASQGYLIELNDMNGKPKAQWNYNNTQKDPISGTQYFYKTDTTGRLDNMVRTVNKDGSITQRMVGVDVDFVSDFRDSKSENYSAGASMNVEIVPGGFIPITIPAIFPSFESNFSQFNSAVITKVVNRYGVLDKTVAIQEGASITTQNLLYDSETGEVLLTRTENEFKDNLYNFTYPAHWAYDGMGPAYKNVGIEFHGVRFGTDTIYLPNGLKPRDYLVPGDECLVTAEDYNATTYTPQQVLTWVYEGPKGKYNLIKQDGKEYAPLHSHTLRVIRSGRRNLQNTPIASITALKNPAQTASLKFDTLSILNAQSVEYQEQWATFCQRFAAYTCNTVPNTAATQLKQLLASMISANQLRPVSFTMDTTTYSALYSVIKQNCPLGEFPNSTVNLLDNDPNFRDSLAGTFMLNFRRSGNGETNCCQVEMYAADSNLVRFNQVASIDSLVPDSAYETNGQNTHFIAVFSMPDGKKVRVKGSSCFNLITCTASCGQASVKAGVFINPYQAGMLGLWRKKRDYKYLDQRKYSSSINTRADGTYTSFDPFWVYNAGTKFMAPQTTNQKWVWTTEVTQYNPYGEEIENKDALNRYSAALYGYNNTLPVAVSSNAKNRQIAFDGFEDYNFEQTANPCDLFHWNFKQSLSGQIYLDTSYFHTGKYALRVNTNQQPYVLRTVQNCEDQSVTASADSPQVYRFKPCDCISLFSPDTGKYLISSWVRQDNGLRPPDTAYATMSMEVVISGTNPVTYTFTPGGPVVESWQRIEGVFDVPAGTTDIRVRYKATTSIFWLDDVRIHPYNGNMKTYVYDPISQKLVAELDENNFATVYEYDKEGALIRVKKETVKGMMTIKESRNSTRKTQ